MVGAHYDILAAWREQKPLTSPAVFFHETDKQVTLSHPGERGSDLTLPSWGLDMREGEAESVHNSH